jgi:hypothetical protein
MEITGRPSPLNPRVVRVSSLMAAAVALLYVVTGALLLIRGFGWPLVLVAWGGLIGWILVYVLAIAVARHLVGFGREALYEMLPEGLAAVAALHGRRVAHVTLIAIPLIGSGLPIILLLLSISPPTPA